LAPKKPKKGPHDAVEDIKYLSEAQVAAFFRQIKDVFHLALFRVIYHRGLRAHEAGLIPLAAWEAAAGMLTIKRGKGSLGGKYRLVDAEAKALRAWLKKRGLGPGALFRSRNHRGIGRKQVYRLMRHYALKAGIPPELAHPHSLKHSCGTHVLDRVKDLYIVKDHLGHRSIQSTEIYARISGKRREEVADQLRDWR
jgi:site-specific recombinase XerC